MKKLIMFALVLATTMGYAQRKRSDKEKRALTPEQYKKHKASIVQ